jgi:hypothetical protein
MYDILQALQIRKQKREEVLAKKRCRGGQSTPPHFVVSFWFILQLFYLINDTKSIRHKFY